MAKKMKRGRGRPKGSKNKVKRVKTAQVEQVVSQPVQTQPETVETPKTETETQTQPTAEVKTEVQ